MIKLGLDFDNTLITYDAIFYKIALERNLIKKNLAKQKILIRDFLRKKNLEDQFTLIQAEVYGRRIVEAKPAENLIENLLILKKLTLTIFSYIILSSASVVFLWLAVLNMYADRSTAWVFYHRILGILLFAVMCKSFFL